MCSRLRTKRLATVLVQIKMHSQHWQSPSRSQNRVLGLETWFFARSLKFEGNGWSRYIYKYLHNTYLIRYHEYERTISPDLNMLAPPNRTSTILFGVPKKIRNLHYRWFPSHGGFSIGKITNHRLNKPRKMWRRWWFWVFLCERIGDLSEDWSKSWAGWFPWEFPWGFHVNYKQLNMIFECGKKWTTLVFTCRSTMEVWGTIFYFKTNISYFCWWYNYELVGWHLAAG